MIEIHLHSQFLVLCGAQMGHTTEFIASLKRSCVFSIVPGIQSFGFYMTTVSAATNLETTIGNISYRGGIAPKRNVF